MSPHCQTKKNVKVERLDKYDTNEGVWKEILIEDRTVGPAELAATRIDFPASLRSLKPRNRRIALRLRLAPARPCSLWFLIGLGDLGRILFDLVGGSGHLAIYGNGGLR